MRAMVLEAIGAPLVLRERGVPVAGPGEVLIRVDACAVCRTDLHVVDGELPGVALPRVPGHEVVGTVEATDGNRFRIGSRVGVPWLAWTCGECEDCREGRENLCPRAAFTGFHRDGGFAAYCVADERFVLPLPESGDAAHAAPLLCAGLIGYRALVMAGNGRRCGLYGFGAAAHILVQLLRHQGRKAYAFTRPGDIEGQAFARQLGAEWAGDSTATAPDALDAAILFAPVGALVPLALRAVRPGGVVVCAGIHMSEIPAFPYALLWGERVVRSVANLTRRDGEAFLPLAAAAGVRTEVTTFPLEQANAALAAVRNGTLRGAAVLRMR